MKRTPWFTFRKTPTRVGWYECFYQGVKSEPLFRRYWDGKRWKLGPDRSAYGCLFGRCIDGRDDKWRGLAEKPE